MQTVAAAADHARARDDAFADVVAAHYDEALRLAWLLTGNQHRAEDAVGEALARMLRRWRSKPPDNPRAYLRRAVVNEVHSSFRRLFRDRRDQSRRTGDDRGALTTEERVADADGISWALERLPDRQRTAVVLFYFEDLTQEETADAMGCALGTAKSSISRGLAKLRVLLDEEATSDE